MRSARRFKSLSLVSLIFLAFVSSANAGDIKSDLDYNAPPPIGDQYQIRFNQGTDGLIGERFSYQVKPTTEKDPSRPLPHYRSLLPVCVTPQDLTCIESVESRRIGRPSWSKGTLSGFQFDVNKLPETSRLFGMAISPLSFYGTWAADKASGLAAGGVASSWDLAETEHTNGFSYLAYVQYTGQFNHGTDLSDFSVMLEPWSWKCAERNSCNSLGRPEGVGGISSFTTGTEFRITIRTSFLSTKIGSWAVGRLEKPTVNLTSEKLVISGSAVVYPMGYATLDSRAECKSKIGAAFSQFFPNAPNLCAYEAKAFSTSSNDSIALSLFDSLDSDVKQNGQIARWSFANIKTKNSTKKCLDSKSLSLATSNAMLYSVQPPVWDERSGTLSYRIASTHKDNQGNVNKGNYSLALSKKTADCLWNFDTQKASAVISITNSEGIQNIAVSTLRTSSNWIYFDASGFTFSSPEIRVKLIKPKVTPAKKTIVCVNKSTTKKVSGTQPTCPPGFKLKK